MSESNEKAHRRLLDLLAGWERYLEKCASEVPGSEEEAEYRAEIEAVVALYQKAGEVTTMTSSEITSFLGSHVLSLLLAGPQV